MEFFDTKEGLIRSIAENESDAMRQTLDFLEEYGDFAYSRENTAGHITGSALVVDAEGNILLNHHKKANIWIQFGGHCDGETDARAVALRETMEETGFAREDLIFLDDGIFECEIYDIPANREKIATAHKHYDIDFLIMTKNKNFTFSNESTELRWCTPEEALVLTARDALCPRMIAKSRQFFEKRI